jgi:enoyl-CoA hydratase/carnithine racemase
MAESQPLISVEVGSEGVALVRLGQRSGPNVLSPELMDELIDRLESLDQGGEARVIVLAGNAKTFAAGADLRSMRDRSFQEAMALPSARFWTRINAVGLPLVAAVSGYALGGGCELALACDLIVAAETAVFGQPEIEFGIIPGGGATQRLTRILGRQRATELILTGRRIAAAEAAAMGLVNRVTASDAWLEEALDLAREIASKPPLGVRLAKRAISLAAEVPQGAGIEQERRLYELAMATEDRVEGMTAFLDKREPHWRGR